jgi:hypothetical protein
LYYALWTTILIQHRQLHHVGMIKSSDALFVGRCARLRQGAHEVVPRVKEQQPTFAELSKLLSIADKLERELSEIAAGLSDDLQRGAVASRCPTSRSGLGRQSTQSRGVSGMKRRSTGNELINIAAELRHETQAAYLLVDGAWVPERRSRLTPYRCGSRV